MSIKCWMQDINPIQNSTFVRTFFKIKEKYRHFHIKESWNNLLPWDLAVRNADISSSVWRKMPPDRKLDPQKRCRTLETANIPGIFHSTQKCAHAEWTMLCANLEELTCKSGFPGQNADWDKYIQLHSYWVMHPQWGWWGGKGANLSNSGFIWTL